MSLKNFFPAAHEAAELPKSKGCKSCIEPSLLNKTHKYGHLWRPICSTFGSGEEQELIGPHLTPSGKRNIVNSSVVLLNMYEFEKLFPSSPWSCCWQSNWMWVWQGAISIQCNTQNSYVFGLVQFVFELLCKSPLNNSLYNLTNIFLYSINIYIYFKKKIIKTLFNICLMNNLQQ